MKNLEVELDKVLNDLDYWQERFCESEEAHDKYIKAELRKSELIREIAELKKEECVFPLEKDCLFWNYEAPMPKVFVNHRKAFLFYSTELEEGADNNNVTELSNDVESRYYVVLSFTNVRSCRIGDPNEDSVIHHQLWNKGLQGLDAGIVKNSSTIRKLRALESNTGESGEKFWRNVSHFIFCFKDQMFECLADDFKSRIFRGLEQDVFSRVICNPGGESK